MKTLTINKLSHSSNSLALLCLLSNPITSVPSSLPGTHLRDKIIS